MPLGPLNGSQKAGVRQFVVGSGLFSFWVPPTGGSLLNKTSFGSISTVVSGGCVCFFARHIRVGHVLTSKSCICLSGRMPNCRPLQVVAHVLFESSQARHHFGLVSRGTTQIGSVSLLNQGQTGFAASHKNHFHICQLGNISHPSKRNSNG